MKLEKVLAKFPTVTVFATVIFLTMTLWLGYSLFVKEEITTQWQMEVVGLDDVVPAGRTTTVQVFLKDEEGHGITDADVLVWLDMPEMTHFIQRPMHHVEDGLYEMEAILSMGGTWVGMLEAKRGLQTYYNQFLIQASGSIVSQEYRDPQDTFDFQQPLPSWINRYR